MNQLKQNRDYVSEIDQFLTGFDQANPELSRSQAYERQKYARINRLRDDAKVDDASTTIWQEF